MDMKNIFLDTSIVNRVLDINTPPADSTYEEDRYFLRKILDICSKNERINLYVNPSVKMELEKTQDEERRRKLLDVFKKCNFMPFSKTVLPFTLPATLLSEKEAKTLKDFCSEVPSLKADKKIIADAAFCKAIDILLTTDREHLARKEIQIKHFRIFTPKQLFDYLRKHA